VKEGLKMNGTMNVTNKNNDISFGRRYLRIHEAENMPKELLEAIKTHTSIDEFIKKGNPTTLREKLRDLFKKDEYLDVYFSNYSSSNSLKEQDFDQVLLTFNFGHTRANEPIFKKWGTKNAFWTNILSIGENNGSAEPVRHATASIIAKLKSITNFEDVLKNG
jgi:hypothetical protein